jgi:diguanylate cyclase (GGDEF)-like protein
MTTIGRWLFALLLWATVTAAMAQDGAARAVPPPAPIVLGTEKPPLLMQHRARYWIDDAGSATAESLEAAGDTIPWRLREVGTNYSIDGKALWFQFDAINPSGKRWFLELGTSGIDRVQFFWKTPDGRWVSDEAGDARDVSEWSLPGRLPAFELAGRTDNPVRYWVRIEHERVDFASPLALYDQASLFASRETEQFMLGGYFSLAALIAIVSLANAIAFRDRNFLVYAVYVMALAVGQLAYLGVGAQHVWTHWLQWNSLAGFSLPGISAAVALWFTRTVTEPRRFSRALDITVWAVIAAILSAVALDAVLLTRHSFLLVLSLVTVAMVVVVALIVLVWIKGEDTSIQWIALGFLPVLVTAVFPILRGFNLIPVSALTRYGVSIGAALEMPILFYALNVRGSRRREAGARTAALSRSDTLTGLAHTRTFLHRLDDALKRCLALKHACGILAVKIANYESIIAEYGRDTAERALVVAASMLRAVTADVDMAARVGDHHFAVLLEGPATAQQTASRAQQLVASGLRENEALPNGLVLKFQVASAMLPDRNLDAGAALDWLLESVNSIRPDSRKLIRPLNF